MENKNIDNLEFLRGKLSEMTPVTRYLIDGKKDKEIFLKRDDKFVLGKVNGGKLRQAIYLINKNYQKIIDNHKSSVVCSSSIKSPQSAIISTVCKAFDLHCNIVTYETKKENRNLSVAQIEGANIFGTKSGYTSVIESFAKKNFPNDFMTNMGFASDDIINANINQVENIPNELDYLVVPVGSAMNFISILKGVKKYNKKIGKIIGVYVGKEPFKSIAKYYGDLDKNVEIIKYPKPYGTEINVKCNDYKLNDKIIKGEDYFFDPIYEAKAFDWIRENLMSRNNTYSSKRLNSCSPSVLLWIVGKRNLIVSPQEINYSHIENKQTTITEVKNEKRCNI